MWSVHLLRTVTGEVGPQVDPVSGSWSIELNKTETGSLTLTKTDLARIPREWWTPHIGGVLLAYTGPDGITRPIVAGPITGWPSETLTHLEVEFEGIRWVLAGRIIAQNMNLTNLSLGSIAWRIVDETCSIKPGAGLPVVHGSPDQETGHQRTYERWNLSNNSVDKRLTELSGVVDGPDIMFRPEWANDEHTLIQWSMVHGTEDRPPIAQSWTADIDTTAPRSGVLDIKVKSEAAHIVTRVWATGSGEGEGVARTYVEDLSSLADRQPFLEKVISETDQGDVEKLRAKASGELAASKRMLDQVDLTIRADSVKHPLGLWHVGDTCNVTLAGWVSIPDGMHPMRLLKASGGLDEKVSLEFQEDAWD